MGALKLECFSNEPVSPSHGAPFLEDFDSARAQAFADGVQSGADATSKAFETEKLRLLSPILESLDDIGFSQVAASTAILHSLRPLIEMLVQTILPQAAKQGFAHEVASLVHLAAEKSVPENITISVPPDAVDAVTTLLGRSKSNVKVVGDAAMTDLSAQVRWGSGSDRIDLTNAQQQIEAVIDEFYKTCDPLTKTGNDND